VKHTVIREQPVQPPIEKIVLEVTPAELLGLYRAIGYCSSDDYRTPRLYETAHGIAVAAQTAVHDSIRIAANAADLVIVF
jgi:hypothetical protein